MLEELHDRLSSLAFFRQLDARDREELARAGEWMSVAGGWPLIEQGSKADRLHFLLSGRLVVVRKSMQGDDEVVGYIRAGEPVGEIALMLGGPHSASVYALRDSEFLTLDRATFDQLVDRCPQLLAALSRTALKRARQDRVDHHRAAPRVFSVVASSPSIDPVHYARQLAVAIERLSLRVKIFEPCTIPPDSIDFDEDEERHDVVLLPCRVGDDAWYRFVLRHSDRFFVLARRDARPPIPFPMVAGEGARARQFRLTDLVMLHEGNPTTPVIDWIDAVSANRVFHLRSKGDLNRWARVIAGKTVGLVLSGGGARAYAHIGVIKAMRERNIPIDFICGASMGAIVAACVAMGWDDATLEQRIRAAFVESNPLGDHVLPVVALTRGARVDTRLETHFGGARIEELTIPYFCVSAELTKGQLHVHRRGVLTEALRASISIPGVLPPVVDEDRLLVDGAVLNNFPADLMSVMHRGITIGVDVARRGSIDPMQFVDPPSFWRWVRHHGLSSAPPIVSLLMRAATTREEKSAHGASADVMITPEVSGVELRDWKKYDEAVAHGYEAAQLALDDSRMYSDVMATD